MFVGLTDEGSGIYENELVKKFEELPSQQNRQSQIRKTSGEKDFDHKNEQQQNIQKRSLKFLEKILRSFLFPSSSKTSHIGVKKAIFQLFDVLRNENGNQFPSDGHLQQLIQQMDNVSQLISSFKLFIGCFGSGKNRQTTNDEIVCNLFNREQEPNLAFHVCHDLMFFKFKKSMTAKILDGFFCHRFFVMDFL